MSVCKFALKLTQNVISPDLILKQKSITIKTLYSDIYRHTHTHRVSENKFGQNHCYLFSDGIGWSVETQIILTHSGWWKVIFEIVYVHCAMYTHHEICTHTGVWVTSIQSIYLIGQITLFSFSTANTGTAIAIFELVRTYPHSLRQVRLFLAHSTRSPVSLYSFFAISIAYKMLHLRSDCDTTTQIGLHQT